MYNLRGIKWKLNSSNLKDYVDRPAWCRSWRNRQNNCVCIWILHSCAGDYQPHDGTCLVCWQASDSVFISQCCLQQDQTVTHSYKLWWYMAPIIPHLDIKTLTCEQNKGWPCTSSCTVSIKMTDGGAQPRFPNITSKIFSFQFHSINLKNSRIMDTRRSLRINIFDYPL